MSRLCEAAAGLAGLRAFASGNYTIWLYTRMQCMEFIFRSPCIWHLDLIYPHAWWGVVWALSFVDDTLRNVCSVSSQLPWWKMFHKNTSFCRVVVSIAGSCTWDTIYYWCLLEISDTERAGKEHFALITTSVLSIYKDGPMHDRSGSTEYSDVKLCCAIYLKFLSAGLSCRVLGVFLLFMCVFV